MKSFNKLYQTIIEARFLTAGNKHKNHIDFKNRNYSPIKYGEGIDYFSRADTVRDANLALDNGEPIFIAGEPGVSKSVTIMQMAQQRAAKMGRQYVVWAKLPLAKRQHLVTPEAAEERAKYYFLMDVRTNLMAKEDATGIPDIMNVKPYTDYRPQLWLHYCTLENSAGMVFFDEMNQGTDDVLKSLMQFFLDKRIGEHSLNDINGHWDITAAGNTESSHGNNPLPPALAQRASIFGMTVSSKEWTEYAKSVNIDPAIITFVNSGFRKNSDGTEDNKYLVAPPAGDNQASVSPRSIEKFNTLYNKILESDSIKDKARSIYNTAVSKLGKEWATDFMTFLELSDKFDFEGYKEDVELFVNNPAKYVAKYGLSKEEKQQAKMEGDLAAQHIEKKYFKHGDNVQLGIILQLAQELFEIIDNELKDINASNISNAPDTAKQAIRQFVEFLKLMESTNNKEINAIMVNMFMSDSSTVQLLPKILAILKGDVALKVYYTLFGKTFKGGNRLKEGKFVDEEEESLTNSQSIMSADNWKKLMQIKHKVDMISGLQNT